MDKDKMVLIVVGLVLAVALLQAFQLSGLVKGWQDAAKASAASSASAGQASLAGSGGSAGLDTSGWTENEKMNYDMHGAIPSRLQGQSGAPSSSAPSQVGGC